MNPQGCTSDKKQLPGDVVNLPAPEKNPSNCVLSLLGFLPSVNCNISEGYFLVLLAVSYCFFSFPQLDSSWVLDSQMACRWCIYVTDFILGVLVLLYAISSHFVFNMNKTTPPASFIRGMWQLGAEQKWWVANQGFKILSARPAKSPRRHSGDLAVHLATVHLLLSENKLPAYYWRAVL